MTPPYRDRHHAQEYLAPALERLQRRLKGRVERGDEICRQHANTLTLLANEPPDAVVFATCTADVVATIEAASHFQIPVVPFGAGTSLEGHLNAPQGGISLDLSAMDQLLEVNPDDLDCRVEAGISRDRLNAGLRDTGLFFPVDPGAGDATLGGMAATRASGTCAVRYGTMRDAVLNVTAVMADASVVKTGCRARKSAAGYDLTHLLVGSEGTLGIITELTLRLFGRPETSLFAVAPFASLSGACQATSEAMQLGLGLARVELLDPLQISAVNVHSGLSLAPAPTLFVELHGSPAGAREQMQRFSELAMANGAEAFDWSADEAEGKQLWRARHDAFWAVKSRWPGRQAVVTDACVPISRLAKCVAETERDIEETGLISPIVGHVGDGNFHCIVMIDRDDASECSRLQAFTTRLAERAIGMEGTCTGEHGIGQGKMALLERELPGALPVMRQIKQALDPKNILNPGKIVSL